MNVAAKQQVPSNIVDSSVLLQILDMLPTSIFVKNENLQFEFSNEAHCRLIGLPAEQLLGYSDADYYPPAEAEQFLRRDRHVLESGEVNECEETATNQSGVSAPYLTRKSKIVTADGKVYLIGTNTNLTEIKKREDQYRALAETVPVGIWHVREDGSTVYVNPLLCELLGASEAEIRARHPADILAGGREGFPGDAVRFETDIGHAAARRALVICSGWLSQAGSSQRSAMISVVDISELSELQRINDEISRLNRELADNMRMLKEAQDENVRRGKMAQLGQLTATVAHELRNPLGAIRTSAFLIERKIRDKNLGIETQLQRISNGIERCDNIITQLLDFARSKSLQCEIGDFDAWLAGLVEEEAQKLPESVGVEVELGLGGRLVPFDPARMSRVIINLVSNASEAMTGKHGEISNFRGDKPVVVVVSRLTTRGVEVSVRDNGPGIPADVLPRILEPLFTTKNFGTGLGLPAVERILEQHGGGLEIANAPAEGACFTAWFPVAARNAEAA